MAHALDFRILGTSLRLSGPPALLEPIAAAYGRFRVEDADPKAVRLAVTDSDPPCMILEGKTRRLVRGLEPAGQVYLRFVELALDRAEHHAVLHAGALIGPRGAFLLAGPAGSGKSALALELLSRGYRFLSDDHAPLDLERSTVVPFHRALALPPGGAAPVPAAARRLADLDTTPRLFGKALLDPSRMFGERCLALDEAPLTHVILLTRDDPASNPSAVDTSIHLIARADRADEIGRWLAAVPGVEIESREAFADVSQLRLLVRAESSPLPRLMEILEDDGILHCEKRWGPPPDFRGEPASAPILRRSAATLLGREMLNRRPSGVLMKRLGGSAPKLLLDLGHALRRADCRQLRVGALGPTADAIERLVAANRLREVRGELKLSEE